MEKDIKKDRRGEYEMNLTWAELEEQRLANERKNNPPKSRIKKYI